MEAVLDEVSGPGQSARWVKDKAPRLVVDPDVVTLAPGRIVLKHTDNGGYFCMGFGPSAEFLRAIDEDDRFNEAIDEAAVALGKLSADSDHLYAAATGVDRRSGENIERIRR
jgi:hypothetical protein